MNFRIEQPNFLTPSKKKIEISTIASNYHIEVNPSLFIMLRIMFVTTIIKM